ncbi:MAG: DNA-processing protein DprA [Alphaproteobacteria bacterium]|nr:DNA-processing protein DprA [Alphaproteobacteria bacterium]MCD8526309.1 DNA-processing protein DprA [Alphaproteobacteria bacterium]MCD8571020.1 DNA-processing protein DprA [Alphaproteobacteria bacterium]
MLNLFESRLAANPDEAERLSWLRLARTENVGPATFARLLEFYGNPSEALKNLPDLAKRGGRKAPLKPPAESDVLKEYAALKKLGGGVLTLADDAYPELLKSTDDAPPVLSYLGDPALLQKQSIGIVGARNASLNGRKLAVKIAQDLGAQGQVVASGLARGIDTAAHEGSLTTGTIAVVAGGIDVIYPPENAGLYEQIKEKGLILAESPLGQQPFAQSFPRRNRIVSGLSRGVVVVEATMRSGSLITARLAGEQGREVWAVPGHPLDPRAEGPNHLIREGAVLIRNAEDIMENLLHFSGHGMREFHVVQNPVETRFEKPEELPGDAEERVLQNLSPTPCGVDELIRACGLTVGSIQTILLELELAGRIKRLPGNRVCLIDG